MSSFVKALEAKIKNLLAVRENHLSAVSALDSKIELLEELLAEEGGELPPATEAKKRRPGRPKGSRNKKTTAKQKSSPTAIDDDLFQEAMAQLGADGTTPEQQEKLSKGFVPRPRPQAKTPTNVRVGRKQDVLGSGPDANTRITVEEEEDAAE